MDEPQLVIRGIFGTNPERPLLIAHVPEPEPDWLAEESAEASAEEPPEPESLLLELSGDQVRLKERVPMRLDSAWQSPRGPAYCSANAGRVAVYAKAAWQIEQVTDDDEDFELIWGISGATAAEDVVFVLGAARAFVRRRGIWSELELPDEIEMVTNVVGRSPDEIYLITDTGVVLYEGSEVSEVEAPDDSLQGMLLRSNGDILITGNEGLHQWSEQAQSWSLYESPAELTMGIVEHPGTGAVLLATREGVLQWDGKDFSFVAEGFRSNELCVLGDVVFAVSVYGGLLRGIGGTWAQVPVPVSLSQSLGSQES
jgi:hypothetical protein